MTVSIALATYNGARFLRQQLASISGQTVLPSELIVGDDGSTDDSLVIVQDFAASAPFPVTILPTEQRFGFSDNFLRTAEACNHELIAFCDQDDVWLPNKLELCANRLRADDSLLALHPLTVTDGSLRPTGLHWSQGADADRVFAALELDPYQEGFGNSMMFRRSLVHLIDRRQRPPQPENSAYPLSHDTWVFMLAAALGRVSHVADPLILYRQHQQNVVGVADRAPRSRIAAAMQVRLERWREQAVINRRMATLFEDLGGRPGPFAAAAQAAAIRFMERHVMMQARVGIFTEPTVSKRYDAFRRFQRLAGPPTPGLGSQVKSLLLGVSGLSV